MRLDIEGKHTPLAPHLMGWIAQRLEALDTPYGDICEARVTFVQQGRREAVSVEFLLAGQRLHVTRRDVRAARRVRLAVGVAQETWQAPVPISAGQVARSAPQA
jgi:hypothetical protein